MSKHLEEAVSDRARAYRGPQLLQIAMPLGGIGAGCVCLNGYGGLQDFSIRNRPDTSALPDGHLARDAAFALIRVGGPKPVTRLLEGPVPVEKIYDQGLRAQGFRCGGYEGLPRMSQATFRAEYPFGRVDLQDPKVPLAVSVTGFSPFIPLDDLASGLPCAILEYRFKNTGSQPVDFEFSFHLSHLAGLANNGKGTLNAVIPGKGAFQYQSGSKDQASLGSGALIFSGGVRSPKIKAMWHRASAGFFDSITELWREVSEGRFQPNKGNLHKNLEGRNGSSLLLPVRLLPGRETVVPVVMAWHFPYSTASSWGQKCACKAWKVWYATRFKDAREVALYVDRHYADLRRRTLAFKTALHASSLPAPMMEAVGDNLAILKSPTVLRQASGHLWGWEGCFCAEGCCPGSCTHVWNYAQAFPSLFPKLEQGLREVEYRFSMDKEGHVNFRAAAPDGPSKHDFHPAADGQLGGILKLYRDWRAGGDDAWMLGLLPLAKRSLDYCVQRWDPKGQGLVSEPHHNTYDIEFWGPESMCTSIYIGALWAMAAMLDHAGRRGEAGRYRGLARQGLAGMERELFNGEYYQQKVMWKELKDQSFARRMARVGRLSSAEDLLLKREGPKYQYGTGCLSDGIIGAWMSGLYGVGAPFDDRRVKSMLEAIFRHNFRRDLSGHANTQRPGYAMGREAGLLLCSWPRGGKPTLPFVYSDEVWTGIEYQVAAHCLQHGLVRQASEIVAAARSRYEGRTRNPFNEYECGSYYARAMASYALLPAFAGFRYDAVAKELFLSPATSRRPFTAFFSTALGWGTLILGSRDLSVILEEGSLDLRKVTLAGHLVRLPRPCRARAGREFKLALQ